MTILTREQMREWRADPVHRAWDRGNASDRQKARQELARRHGDEYRLLVERFRTERLARKDGAA